MTKDDEGEFSILSKEIQPTFAEKVQNEIMGKKHEKTDTENGYLIYIVTQEVIFNEEISTITYFKDITFGVLYE